MTTVKLSPFENSDRCTQKQIIKKKKIITLAKLLTNISKSLLKSTTLSAQQCDSKGYSLYSRQVSLIPVEIPFPKGTSTPSRVVVAVGSGAVLPKPRKGKNIS